MHVACLCMCVLFCLIAFLCMRMTPIALRGCHRAGPGFYGLSYYCTPLVCVPEVWVGPTVSLHNKLRTKNQALAHNFAPLHFGSTYISAPPNTYAPHYILPRPMLWPHPTLLPRPKHLNPPCTFELATRLPRPALLSCPTFWTYLLFFLALHFFTMPLAPTPLPLTLHLFLDFHVFFS